MPKRLWLIILVVFLLSGCVSKINTQNLIPQQKTVTNLTIERRDVKENDTHIVEVSQLPKDETSIKTVEDEVEETKEEIKVVEDIKNEVKDYIEINVELTFYTTLASCNGKYAGLTASGEYLNKSTLAVPRKPNSTRPVFPFGTKVYIEGYGDKIVQDTGNPKYIKIDENGTYIMDILIERNKGESDTKYRRRIVNMGRVQTTAKVYYIED